MFSDIKGQGKVHELVVYPGAARWYAQSQVSNSCKFGSESCSTQEASRYQNGGEELPSQCPFQRLTPRSLLGVGCVTSSRPALTGDRDQGYLADTVRGGAAQAAIFEACVGDSNVGVAERPSILSRGGCCCWEVRRAEWWLESIYLRVEVGLVLLLLFQLKEGLQ